MVEPDHAQHRRDMEAYQAYKRKDRVARILMLSSMRNDSMLRFGKLGPRGKKCIFIRYSKFSKGYVFLGEDMTVRVT